MQLRTELTAFVYLKGQIQACPFPHTAALDLGGVRFLITVHISSDKSSQQAPYEIQQEQLQSPAVGKEDPLVIMYCGVAWLGSLLRKPWWSWQRASSTWASMSWRLRRPMAFWFVSNRFSKFSSIYRLQGVNIFVLKNSQSNVNFTLIKAILLVTLH